MIRRPPRSTRTDKLCPYTTRFRAEFDAIMLTSANALLHGGPQLDRFKHLPAFAVGEATGEAAREAGFTVAAAGRSDVNALVKIVARSEEHTSELQSLMRISYAVFCLKKKNAPYLIQLHKSIL